MVTKIQASSSQQLRMKAYTTVSSSRMGHHKQNTKGMNAQNTNGIILEYHNIILNENLFDENLRIHYSNDYTDGIRKKWPSLTQDKKQ